MVLRVASAATVPLFGIVLGLTVGLGLPSSQALAQYYPPPPGTYTPAPPQPYPGSARQLPPPVADDDDDLQALGPPRTFGFPPTRPQPYGGRPVYPQDADTYAPPPPPGGVYGGAPPPPPGGVYGAAPPQYPGPQYPGQENAVRPPMSIGPDAAIAALPPDYQPETGPAQLPPQFRRTQIEFKTKEPAGTIIIDTPNTYLYLVLGNGKAMRYGIGVGREGFTWSGTERVSRMAEWPDWRPPPEMIDRQPYLPRFMAGGESNPLGARALYLGKTEYRIHGTNQPSTIGTFVSSGCIRLTNEDVSDLYSRVQVGTRVVVLPSTHTDTAQANPPAGTSYGGRQVESAPLAPPPAPVRTR
jgi:lipoprotein-anchoring transpeptidase ErfK/SrfK